MNVNEISSSNGQATDANRNDNKAPSHCFALALKRLRTARGDMQTALLACLSLALRDDDWTELRAVGVMLAPTSGKPHPKQEKATEYSKAIFSWFEKVCNLRVTVKADGEVAFRKRDHADYSEAWFNSDIGPRAIAWFDHAATLIQLKEPEVSFSSTKAAIARLQAMGKAPSMDNFLAAARAAYLDAVSKADTDKVLDWVEAYNEQQSKKVA